MNVYAALYKRPGLSLLLLIASGLIFGTLTLNIFHLLSSNWDFISRHGLMALREGAARQLLELIFTGSISMLVYLLFKLSENVLMDWVKNRQW